MTTAQRRTLADMVNEALPPAAAPAAGEASSPAAASASSTPPPIGGGAGPRLRATAKSTLRNADVRRTVYMPPDLWRDVLRLADGEGVTAAAIVRQAVAEHVARARRRGR